MGKDKLKIVIGNFCENSKEKQIDIINKFYSAFTEKNRLNIRELMSVVGASEYFVSDSGGNLDGILVENYGGDESAVDKLFSSFPDNDYESALLKVIVINQLYSTMLNNSDLGNAISIRKMAEHINKFSRDIEIVCDENQVVDLVEKIGGKEFFDVDKNNAYSFASKYLSFTFRNHKNKGDWVPITDSYARKTLQRFSIDEVNIRSNLDFYPNYYKSMRDLRSYYNGGNDKIMSYKKLDAFLWIMGKVFS